MVSVSPPREAAKHNASVGLSKKRVAMANAAATDSLASTLVPQSRRRMVANSPSDMEPSSLTAHSMNIFTRATTDALADQLPRGGWDSTNANAFERKPRSPAMARLTAAATSVVDSMPCMVLCVTTQERQASSAKAFPGMKAMPTGVARMAPPFVVPNRPVSSGSIPSASACRAALVDGPSRSSEPFSFIFASQRRRSWAYASLSILPWSSMRRAASTKACSVSSVTEPAFIFGAIGCCGTASINLRTGPP